MNNLQVLLTLIGALWASYGSGMTGAKTLNEIRNHIIRGKDDLGILSIEYRKHMLYNDWLPLIIASALLFLIFLSIMIILPVLIDTNSIAIYIVCYCAAAYPLLGVIGYTWTAIADFRKMKNHLSKELDKVE